jgi:hypothetical protein
MTEMSAPLAEWLAGAIPQEARNLHRTYALIPVEDLEQELWATALKKSEGLERLLEQGAYGVMRKRVAEGGFKAIREDDRYRRAVKAARAGYRPVDEQFYTNRTLETLLPMWLDNGVTEKPPQGREIKVGVSTEGGGSDYMAMMLDITHAMEKIKPYHASILRRYYDFPQGSGGWTHNEIASSLGIPPDALRMRRNRALRAVRAVLGGRNPWNRQGLEYQDSGQQEPGKAA